MSTAIRVAFNEDKSDQNTGDFGSFYADLVGMKTVFRGKKSIKLSPILFNLNQPLYIELYLG